MALRDVKITPLMAAMSTAPVVGESIDGESFGVSACAIMHVRNGKIVRVDDIDSAPIIRLGLDTGWPKADCPLAGPPLGTSR